MEKQIFSIRDSKGEVYNQPFYKNTPGEAERDFRQLVNDEKSLVHKFPEDFDLYKIGIFNDQTGTIKSLDTPQHVVKGISVKN